MKQLNLTSTQWAYFAGMVDGEGCIGFDRTPRSIDLAFAFSTVEPLATFKEWFGDHILVNPYETKIRGRIKGWRALPLLEGCLPYLILKRRQAELAIQLLKLKGQFNLSKRIDPAIRANLYTTLDTLGSEISALKEVCIQTTGSNSIPDYTENSMDIDIDQAIEVGYET